MTISDKELSLLKELRPPSATLQADSKRYMTNSAYRAEVDAKDKAEGTSMGKWLRATFYGEKMEAPAPVVKPEPTAVELAAAVKAFSKERIYDLYVGTRTQSGETRHTEILSKLSPEDRAQSKLAAKFHGIKLSDDDGSSVRFVYSTTRDRAAKRAEKEANREAIQFLEEQAA